jgi:hypothetical protein
VFFEIFVVASPSAAVETVAFPLAQDPDFYLFAFDCYEGNYWSMRSMLGGARLEDRLSVKLRLKPLDLTYSPRRLVGLRRSFTDGLLKRQHFVVAYLGSAGHLDPTHRELSRRRGQGLPDQLAHHVFPVGCRGAGSPLHRMSRVLRQVKKINNWDLETLVAGHVTRTGTRADVATRLLFMEDLKGAAQTALKRTKPGEGLNPGDRANPWAVFDHYIDRVVVDCMNQMIPKWSTKLAAFDVYIWDQCYSMEQSLRID